MRTILIAALLIVPASALADQNAANSCAAALSKDGKTIYAAVGPSYKPGTDLRALMEAQIPGLVRAGKVERSSARSNAVAAAECLTKR